MRVKQIVLKQRTSAQIKEEQPHEKVNKKRGEEICI